MPVISTSELVALLRPWKAALRCLSVDVMRVNKNGMVAVSIDTYRATNSIREAMDLLCLAVIVNGAVLNDLLVAKWLKDGLNIHRKGKFASLTGVRGVYFSAAHYCLDIHAFSARLMRILSSSRAQSGPLYKTTRETLVQIVITQGLGHRLGETLLIKCEVILRQESPFGMFQNRAVMLSPLLAVEDFFTQLADLAKTLKEHRDTPSEVTCMRFDVSAIRLKLEMCLPITTTIVDAVEALFQAQEDGRVQCTEVNLDPRHISCSAEDLVRFVKAISRGSPGLSISTGFTPLSTRMQAIDRNGEDRSAMISAMMHALASCSCLETVDLGPLLYLLGSSRNRKCVWHAVHEILLSRSNPSPIRELLIDSDAIVAEEDASCIKRLRGLRTQPCRQVKCLRLGSIASDRAIFAILALVRDMTEIDIVVPVEEVASVTVSTILQQFPKIKSLRVCYATIDSMAVFSDPQLRTKGKIPGSCLEKLELFVPHIVDRTSIPIFLSRLADPMTAIARTLCYVAFDSPSGERGCELDVTSATILKQVLETNRTLRWVEVMLDTDVPKSLKKALESHEGDIIVQKGPIPEQEARKRAFLSVIREKERSLEPSALTSLDVTMIREIFAFTAPYNERRVMTSYVEEAESDEEEEEEEEVDE